MKRFSVRFFEIVCVVVLCFFISAMVADEEYSDKTVKEVEKTALSSINIDGLSLIKTNKIKEEFGFDFEGIEGCRYYASDSIMDVREFMIIKLKPDVKPNDVLDIIENRVKEKQILFDGYAPEESAMLKNYELKYQSGFVFYAVGKDSAEALKAFLSAF